MKHRPTAQTVVDPSTDTTASLAKLLETASLPTVIELIKTIILDNPTLERECITFLVTHNDMPGNERQKAAANQAWGLWFEIDELMQELANYAGSDSDYETVQSVLSQIADVVSDGKAPADCRQDLQSMALKYLESGNLGISELFDLAKACCHTTDEWRELAQTFEAAAATRPSCDGCHIRVAMDIYRQIRDDDRYLALRLERLDKPGDFLELAKFYAEIGDMDQAIEVARAGLTKDQDYNSNHLRQFLADHALSSGDRTQYLELMFANATHHLSLESYQSFEALCSATEWQAYEARILLCLSGADAYIPTKVQVGIRLHRNETELALLALLADRGGLGCWQESALRRYARQLEDRFPAEILSFYRVKLGTIERGSRRHYAEQACCITDIKRVMLILMRAGLMDPSDWQTFLLMVRTDSRRLPAFRDELRQVLPDEVG